MAGRPVSLKRCAWCGHRFVGEIRRECCGQRCAHRLAHQRRGLRNQEYCTAPDLTPAAIEARYRWALTIIRRTRQLETEEIWRQTGAHRL